MPLMEPLRFGMRRSGGMSNLSPDDEESLVRKATRAGLSGLGMVGNLLDLPGSIFRDLITFLPGGPSPVNPLDQLLSPLSSDNRTSGRQLLEGYGLRQNRETGMGGWLSDPGEGVRDVAGFAADVVLDPLTWLTGGAAALGRGAKTLKASGLADDVVKVAAKKAGVPLAEMGPRQARLTTTVDDLVGWGGQSAYDRVSSLAKERGVNVDDILDESVGGLAKVKGMDSVLGTGPKSVAVAKWLDKWSPNPFGGEMGSAWAQSAPGAAVKSLMYGPALGKLTPEVQAHAERLFDRQQATRSAARGTAADRTMNLLESGMSGTAASRQIRSAAEQIPDAMDVGGVGGSIRSGNDRWFQTLRNDGYDVRELEDPAAHAMRQSLGSPAPSSKGPTIGKSAADVNRQDPLKGFHAGTTGWRGLEDIITDPDVRGAVGQLQSLSKTLGTPIPERQMAKAVGTVIADKYGDVMDLYYPARNEGNQYLFKGGRSLSASEVGRGNWLPGAYGAKSSFQRVDAQGNVVETLTPLIKYRPTELAETLLQHPKRMEQGLFVNHPIVDAHRYDELSGLKHDAAVSAREFLADYARPKDVAREGMKVGAFLNNLGLTTDDAVLRFAETKGLAKPTNTADLPAFLKDIKELEVDRHLADDYLAARQEYKMPDGWTGATKLWDSFTNLFKASVLSWPATKVRDAMSGQLHNAEKGMFDFGSGSQGISLLLGQAPKGLKEIPWFQDDMARRGWTATDENAKKSLQLLYARIGPGRTAQHTDVIQTAAGGTPAYDTGIDQFIDMIPGVKPSTGWEKVKDVAATMASRTPDTTWNPLKLRGVGDETETSFGLVKGFERIGRGTDDMNRIVPLLNLMKKGVDPDEAMRRINQAQVSYDPKTFTPTEQALKRLLPFYSFSSRKLADVGQTLTTNPGGRTGQTIRAINAGRDSDELVPEHIADTAAIPLPAKVSDGTKRYLTGLGLMMEDPLQLFGGPRASGLEVLSRLNPAIKGPLEWATGQSFFQKSPQGGRPIDDLDPTLGRILANVSGQEQAVKTPQWLEALLGNSPLTRVLTTTRQMTDKRKTVGDKALAALTGVRVSDVSPAAQDAILRQQLDTMIRELGGKSFVKTYFAKEDLAAMDAQQQTAAIKLQALMNTLANRAKSRREAKEKSR